MDVNEYMKRSLELQERTAAALEALVKAGFQQVNVAHHSCGKTTGGAQTKQVEAVEMKAAETKAETKQDAPAEAKQEAKQETKQETKQDAPAETKQETKQEDKPKKVTADDARKALKAYAAVEGNDAAMELLTSMGASSVSALAEQGEDKLRELVAKCEGK